MKRSTTWVLNTKKDFISFCKAYWYKEKDIRWILDLLTIFIKDSMINKWKLVLTWIWTFYKKETTSTLRPWQKFYKVKINLSDNITWLFSKKW